MLKRYQFWASENGKPCLKWTEFFYWDGEQYEYQLKSKLKNEYKDG